MAGGRNRDKPTKRHHLDEYSENNLDTARAYSASGALPSGRKAWEFRARQSVRAGSGGQGRGPSAAAGGRSLGTRLLGEADHVTREAGVGERSLTGCSPDRETGGAENQTKPTSPERLGAGPASRVEPAEARAQAFRRVDLTVAVRCGPRGLRSA